MRALIFVLMLILLGGLSFSHPQTAGTTHSVETVRYIYSDPGQLHTTEISGFKGTTKPEIKEPGSNAFLNGLEFDEKSDKPCFIRAHWWRFTADSLADKDVPEDFTTFFNICGADAKGDKSLIFSSIDTQRQAVDSIRVCSNNDNNHRVKGVELTSGFVDRKNSGKVENAGSKLSFERTNCAPPWKTTQTCPTGMAAIGLVVEHSGDEITGLGLKCTKPMIKVFTTAESSASAVNERFAKMEADIQVDVDKNEKKETMTIREALVRHEVNGATVVVIDNGNVSTVRHYGIRSRKSNLPTNKDTLYQAASTSKFVAAIGMLIAARKDHGPKLNRSVQATANANPNSLIARWADKQFNGGNSSLPKDITVERMLNHTAGLDTHGIGTARTNSPTNMENILLGQGLNSGVKPQNPPGHFYSYSGGGFVAAEAMLEIHSGRTATSFLNNDVLPLFGMTKSTFNTATDSMANLARGCSRGICSSEPEFTLVKFAGGLLANPEEYGRLLVIILNYGKDSSGKQVIPLADVQRLMTPSANIQLSSNKTCTAHTNCGASEKCYSGKCIVPIKADDDDDGDDWYGLGVYLSDDSEFQGYPRRLSHGGAQDNAVAYFLLDRGDRNGIIIMVNGESVWKKKDVAYGAEALKNDIIESFFRNYP